MAVPLVQEQAVPQEIAPEQAAPEEIVPEQAAPEEVEMAKEEVLEKEPEKGGDVLDEVQFLFGRSKENLTVSQ